MGADEITGAWDVSTVWSNLTGAVAMTPIPLRFEALCATACLNDKRVAYQKERDLFLPERLVLSTLTCLLLDNGNVLADYTVFICALNYTSS